MSTDSEFLRARRAKAARMFGGGKSQGEVARQLHVSRATALRWFRAWQQRGALRLGRRGRPPKLAEQEAAAIREALALEPREHGIDSDRWTAPALARVIEDLTGVAYHVDHVRRACVRLNCLSSGVDAGVSGCARRPAERVAT